MLERAVVVTRKTRLAELLERFGTRGQARFYLQHAGTAWEPFEEEDTTYRQSLDAVMAQVQQSGLKVQVLDRALTPTALFTPQDVIITVGQDGLVANTAKYVAGQPILAVNPDPARMDGVLLPLRVSDVEAALKAVLAQKAPVRKVTLAQVTLSDGQTLLAFNDVYVGVRSHTSARYRIRHGGKQEVHSSSGVLVSTGAGSTGWLSSVFNMVSGVCTAFGARAVEPQRMAWEDGRLLFVVREPFVSRASAAGLVAGVVEPGGSLVLESLMPSGGAIFSDGMEADFVPFNAGVTATVGAAKTPAILVNRPA
jgi:NAD kinase